MSVFDAGCCGGEIAFLCRSLCVCFIESGVFHVLLFDFDFDFDFVCWIDWGRHRHSSLSMSHTLQAMALARKVALRFLHLWFIFRIWKNWVSTVSVF